MSIDIRHPSRVRRLATPRARFERASEAAARVAVVAEDWATIRRQALLDEQLDTDASVRQLAERFGLSPTQVQRILVDARRERAQRDACASFRGVVAEPCTRCGAPRDAHEAAA